MDERRERLLSTGLELFGRQGYETISVDEIAAAAGISRGLLYHYFPGKRDFYVAVVREAVDELLELIEPDPDLEPAEQLRASLRAYFAFVLRRRAGYLAVTQWGADPAVATQTDRVRQRVMELILAGAGEGSAELRVALRGWIGYLEGLVDAWLGGDEVVLDRLVELATATLAVNLQAADRRTGGT
jgi:AcrR family transcriptional regulator